jgi:hypothetical protein
MTLSNSRELAMPNVSPANHSGAHFHRETARPRAMSYAPIATELPLEIEDPQCE